MKTIKLGRDMKHAHGHGSFRIEILYPGEKLGQGDSGIGAIGRIDHATIGPGGFIGMHPHRDDEILTYMRSGLMLHRDTVGEEEAITATRLMLMGAGRSFQHEERFGGTEEISLLQIFIRPRARDLEPKVQFHDFGAVHSPDAWRMIAGPNGAPLELRASAWVQDARLVAGKGLELPRLPVPRATRLLYAFSGLVSVGETVLSPGESLILTDETEVTALETSDLVLFTTDTAAPVFNGGMFSGNAFAR